MKTSGPLVGLRKNIAARCGSDGSKAQPGGKSNLPLVLVVALPRGFLLKGRPDTRGGFRPLRLRPFLLFVLGLVEDASLPEKSPVGVEKRHARLLRSPPCPWPLSDLQGDNPGEPTARGKLTLYDIPGQREAMRSGLGLDRL